ncbi:MAG: zinc-ribbon domain-containing protein [Anaerolineae bacterium]|nr:zinc-ribbon domain-containing protein [Anaerolineae bacterium]
MALTCKQCGTNIPASSEDQSWARCPNCQAVLSLTGTEDSTDLAQAGAFLPPGMKLRRLSDGLQLTYNWFNPSYLGLAFMALLWTGFIVGGFNSFGWWLLIVPHFWVGVGMGVVALINLINRTRITITPDKLSIVHFPIPFPFYRRFDPIFLKQLYVREVKHQHKSSVSYTYDLYVTTWSGRSHKLVSKIKAAHLALALEKEIERFLGIKDQSMPGEFRWLSERENRQLWQTWQGLAKALSLKFDPGPFLEKSMVAGVYRGYNLQVAAFYNSQHRRACTRIQLASASPLLEASPLLTSEDLPDLPLSSQQVLSLLTSGDIPREKGAQIEVSADAQKIYYEHPQLSADVQQLRQMCDRVVNLAQGYAKLRAVGAEAVPALETIAAKPEHVLNAAARQLIQDTAADTTTRLGHQPDSFYCRRCLTRCAAYTGQVTLIKTVTYYGCRTCRQSRALLEWAGPVVAVLDSGMTEKWVAQAGTVRVNWLLQRALFDFEAVEIVQASDEDIERFAVQVGNDTDPLRQPYYKEMSCRIGLSCHLSDNSLRVLRSIFGSVERGPLLADVSETATDDRREIEDQEQSVSGSITPS